jgi:uncharacterized protein YjgD (DUF1641 family)
MKQTLERVLIQIINDVNQGKTNYITDNKVLIGILKDLVVEDSNLESIILLLKTQDSDNIIKVLYYSNDIITDANILKTKLKSKFNMNMIDNIFTIVLSAFRQQKNITYNNKNTEQINNKNTPIKTKQASPRVDNIPNVDIKKQVRVTPLIFKDLVFTLKDNAYVVKTYNGYSKDIVIPSVFNGKPVSTIGDKAFYKSTIASIKIPTSIKNIGIQAFSWCQSLTTIVIPESVDTINSFAFSDCNNLTTINLPDSIDSINDFVFSNCKNLKTIILPNELKTIGKYAFSYCYSMNSITIPNNVTTIAEGAFKYCSSLTTIALSNKVTSIGKGAFEKCLVLQDFLFPLYLKKISPSLFEGCSHLRKLLLPVGIESIGNCAFKNCESLSQINFSESVKSLGEEAFYGCRNLTSFSIPYITEIKRGVFSFCVNLKEIIIPNTVLSIEEDAFKSCLCLKSINIPRTVVTIKKGAFNNCYDIKIYTSMFSNTSGWELNNIKTIKKLR